MTRPPARLPHRHPRPYQVTILPFRSTLDDQSDAKLEAVVAQTIAAFRRTGLVYNGDRSLVMGAWAGEINRVAASIEGAGVTGNAA